MRFDVVALHSTNLQIAAGQTTVLIGPSGCGKSTILRLIIGLLTPTSGAVEFEGVPVSQNNILALRRRMGYVIQDGGLFPHLTASQNVNKITLRDIEMLFWRCGCALRPHSTNLQIAMVRASLQTTVLKEIFGRLERCPRQIHDMAEAGYIGASIGPHASCVEMSQFCG